MPRLFPHRGKPCGIRPSRAALVLSLLLLFVGIPAVGLSASSDDNDRHSRQLPKVDFVAGSVLVRFKPDAAIAEKSARARASVALRDKTGREIAAEVQSVEGFEIVEGLRLARVAPAETLKAVEAFRARADVLYAEPDYIWRKTQATLTPNDPSFASQYALSRIGAPLAWTSTTGSNNVVVAVIDEGVDTNHPDLQGNIWQNPQEIAGNNVDDDGDGFVDDVNGWDFTTCNPSTPQTTVCGDNTVFDGVAGSNIDRHGTHVAGIIGARGNNGLGIAGVNWQVSLLPVKVLGQDGTGPTSNIIRAYNYVRRLRERGVNVRVTNNSYGGGAKSLAALDAINQLSQAGILLVAAAGNDAHDNFSFPHYPSDYDAPNVISVAATDEFDNLPYFSNFGARSVQIAAPGLFVLSTVPNANYFHLSGTSMAAPHVSGVAALVLSLNPNISVQNLRGVLAYSGDLVPALQEKTTTGRRLNAAAAITSAQENDSVPPAQVGNLRVTSQQGRSVTLAWNASGDDLSSGTAADYDFFFVRSDNTRLMLPSTLLPAPAGTEQSVSLTLPFRNFAGSIELRAYDNAGNFSASSVAVSIPQNIENDPYTPGNGAAEALSTGGTPLGIIGDDTFREHVALPFTFPFYGVDRTQLTVSSNGVLYFSPIPKDPDNQYASLDAASSVEGLRGQSVIAGLWDDLRTDRGGNVYMVQPDASRVIFRWEAVTFDSLLSNGTSRGEQPVSFEIELRNDGQIKMRYGAGQAAPVNTQLFPVVGISGGEPDPYVAEAHTSEAFLKNLTNAQSVTFTPRAPATPRATISGRISAYCCSGFIDTNGITVTLTGSQNITTTTDASGSYQFRNLPVGGNYTVTPSKAGITFIPGSATFNNLSKNETADFTAEHLRLTISGRVTNASGAGLSGITILMNGGNTGSTQTDANGFYSFTVFEGQSYHIVPVSQSYFFTPGDRHIFNITTNQTVNFTVTPFYNIRGRVLDRNGKGVPNVFVMASWTGNFRSSTTDANGSYFLNDLLGGLSYTITLQNRDYAFSPAPLVVNNLSGNEVIDFNATRLYIIEGRVTDANGNPLGNVTLSISGGQTGTAKTMPPGAYYIFSAPEGGTYTVTPQAPGYISVPASRTVTNLRADTYTEHFILLPSTQTLLDDSQFFVRQHYLDFFNREPDAGGLAFWKNQIDECTTLACREVRRVNVSAAFFLSTEFQESGYLAYRMYKAAYGDTTSPNVEGTVPVIRFQEFLTDTQRIGRGVIVGEGNWQQQLEANKQAFALEFVARQRFLTAYPLTMTNAEFVSKLMQNTGVSFSPAERDQLLAQLSAAADATAGRAAVVRSVAESAQLRQAELNRAFVLMQYFGYLRRNPDDAPDTDFRGWKFWLDKLNNHGGNYVSAEMVKSFIISGEYQQRFPKP